MLKSKTRVLITRSKKVAWGKQKNTFRLPWLQWEEWIFGISCTSAKSGFSF